MGIVYELPKKGVFPKHPPRLMHRPFTEEAFKC